MKKQQSQERQYFDEQLDELQRKVQEAEQQTKVKDLEIDRLGL